MKGKNLPSSITINDIKKKFLPFASDSKTLYKRNIKGKSIKDNYPFVTINENRVAFITFDDKTSDAMFALLMTKKITINNFTIFFGHSYRNDRDMINEKKSRRKTKQYK